MLCRVTDISQYSIDADVIACLPSGSSQSPMAGCMQKKEIIESCISGDLARSSALAYSAPLGNSMRPPMATIYATKRRVTVNHGVGVGWRASQRQGYDVRCRCQRHGVRPWMLRYQYQKTTSCLIGDVVWKAVIIILGKIFIRITGILQPCASRLMLFNISEVTQRLANVELPCQGLDISVLASSRSYVTMWSTKV